MTTRSLEHLTCDTDHHTAVKVVATREKKDMIDVVQEILGKDDRIKAELQRIRKK